MGCCRTLSGFMLDCTSNIGGIKRIWINCFDNVDTPTLQNDKISSITIPTDPEDGWKEYEFRKQTGSVTTTITRDDAIGYLYYESAITLQFTKQETPKRIEIGALAINKLSVIVEDNNGLYWYFGFDYGVTLSDGTAETGTAFSDLNGYNITLNDISKELPYELAESAINQLLGIETP